MKQSEEVVRQEAQQQAEDAFNGFMLWMIIATLWSCLFLAVVVFGCNAGVEDDSYPAYNGEQYNPSNMNNK